KGHDVSLLLVLLLAGLATVLGWLIPQNLAAGRQRRAARAGYFAEVAGVLDGAFTRVEPTGFARLAGRRRGVSFDLQALPDTLTYRKLPALWVLITLTEPVAVRTEIHIMARPTQNEVFSHFALMSEAVALPPGFPDDCALRCDDAALLPPREVIAGLAAWFGDPKVKEVVLSPKGLRVVLLGEEADRGAYLLFRDAEMGKRPLPAARVLPYLDVMTAMRDALAASEETMHG
ncbi:MAG: hypothetical protein ABI832_12745, partial [bacterium]